MGEEEHEELEVTPEMIEAGVRAYYSVDMRVADDDYRVFKVFEAMVAKCHTLGRRAAIWPDPNPSD
jgi:hypothetical protein